MQNLKQIVLDFIEANEGNLDFWIKTEKGHITGIDISRNDVEQPAPADPLQVTYGPETTLADAIANLKKEAAAVWPDVRFKKLTTSYTEPRGRKSTLWFKHTDLDNPDKVQAMAYNGEEWEPLQRVDPRQCSPELIAELIQWQGIDVFDRLDPLPEPEEKAVYAEYKDKPVLINEGEAATDPAPKYPYIAKYMEEVEKGRFYESYIEDHKAPTPADNVLWGDTNVLCATILKHLVNGAWEPIKIVNRDQCSAEVWDVINKKYPFDYTMI